MTAREVQMRSTGRRTATRSPAAIQQASDEVLQVEEGSLYPALQRMLVKGWVTAEWVQAGPKRQTRVYQLTPLGRRTLEAEIARDSAAVAAGGRSGDAGARGRRDELLRVGSMQGEYATLSYGLFTLLRDSTPELEQMAALQAGFGSVGVRRGGTGVAEPLVRQFVSGSFFELFGLSPFARRLLAAEDDRAGAALVAVMSYHLWQRKYGGDPSVIGDSVVIEEFPSRWWAWPRRNLWGFGATRCGAWGAGRSAQQ